MAHIGAWWRVAIWCTYTMQHTAQHTIHSTDAAQTGDRPPRCWCCRVSLVQLVHLVALPLGLSLAGASLSPRAGSCGDRRARSPGCSSTAVNTPFEIPIICAALGDGLRGAACGDRIAPGPCAWRRCGGILLSQKSVEAKPLCVETVQHVGQARPSTKIPLTVYKNSRLPPVRVGGSPIPALQTRMRVVQLKTDRRRCGAAWPAYQRQRLASLAGSGPCAGLGSCRPPAIVAGSLSRCSASPCW